MIKNRVRIIRSVSGVITNSSTEIFAISGSDSLKVMIGAGVFKKFKSLLVYLKTEFDVENFLIHRGAGFNHNYESDFIFTSRPDLYHLWDLYLNMTNAFPDRSNEIWDLFFKSRLCTELKGSIMYYDYRRNDKLMNLLEEKFDSKDKFKNYNISYGWAKD